ncbi:MAG: DoxX family protein [Actinomycetota bacterium]|nr:DoxX family protein [Actinomycetota bacterium]
MSLQRRIARPMLASMFIAGGLDTLLNPGPKVPVAGGVAPKVAEQIPGMSEQDTEVLIRINGGVQLGGGALLALGRFPRLSSLALAATLLPTTAAAHRFWELDDPDQRSQQKVQFLKNVSMLGGLLISSLDTEGRPGLSWRTRHAAEHAGASVRRTRREAGESVRRTRREARLAAKSAKVAAKAKLAG